ncbi:hypothetical protein [Paenibacillus hubeiensis]|uniref:CdiA C-terminal domain-containing protein n=1 Tax=Paenibacillus hubeiensis TaxID=3077330 RepID=UPI0031BA1F77
MKWKEARIADLLAENGYRTIMLDEVPNGSAFDGNGYGVLPNKSPDFIIEGQMLDCYAPGTNNMKTNLGTLRDKTTYQANDSVKYK